MSVTERTFFDAACHRSALRLAMLHDHVVGALVVARLEALRELAPGRARMTTAAGVTLAAAHRMIDRVLSHAAVVRPTAHPALAACFAEADVLVLEIRHLADGRP